MATSLFPCCVPSISKNTVSSSFQDDCCKHLPTDKSEDKEDKQEQKESCSPFFTCGSCAGFSFMSLNFNFFQQDNFVSHQNYYQVSNTPFVFNEKWQPPKLA